MVNSVFITGSNRGIGLELVRQFLKQDPPPKHVFATCRNPNSALELKALQEQHKQTLHIFELEVTNWEKHQEVVDKVKNIVGEENGLNLLINNAGLLPSLKTLHELTPDTMIEAYKTNCVAPVFLTRAFLPLLKNAAAKANQEMSINGGCVVEMSTSVASIEENAKGGNYSYRCSKAALNMGMKNLSIDLNEISRDNA